MTDGEAWAQHDELARQTSRVSHDLNNLVSVILGYASLLVDQVSPDSPARRMAEEVQTAAYQAADLTRQLVELRQQQKELERALAPAAEATPGLSPKPAGLSAASTVLIVEDDPGVRRLAESILSRGGFHVLLAPEVDTALALCSAHPGAIDVLLTDVVMPGGGARELVDRVLAIRPAVRVLFMSGYAADEVPESGDAFLSKPFTAEALLAHVKRLLSSHDSGF